MNVLEGIGIASLVLYGLLGLACIISFILSLSLSSSSARQKDDVDPAQIRIQQLYHVFLGCFVAVRISWVTLHTFYGSSIISFVLNRCGFVLFFTAFTIVLFYWAELYHKSYIVARGFLPRLFKIFVITNAVLYAIEIIVVIMFLIADRDNYNNREGNPFYESSVYLEISVSFVVSIAFLIYGMRLFMQHGRAHDFEENSTKKAREILTILVATIIFTACFLVRVVVFLYRPITGQYMNQQAFQVLAYYVPEIIPSIVQFYLIRGKLSKEKKDTQFIQNLYQQEEDVLQEDLRMQQVYLHHTQFMTRHDDDGGGGLITSMARVDGSSRENLNEKTQLLP